MVFFVKGNKMISQQNLPLISFWCGRSEDPQKEFFLGLQEVLQRRGYPSQITDNLPKTGIVIANQDYFEQANYPLPNSSSFFIGIQNKQAWIPNVQVQVVAAFGATDPKKYCFFLPFPLKQTIKSRSVDHGNRFKKVAYFSLLENLVPELVHYDFCQTLERLGFSWRVITDPNCWDDYQDIDAVIIPGSLPHPWQYRPGSSCLPEYSTLFYQAWLAGVPVISSSLGAYQIGSQKDIDYLEVNSVAEVIQTLKHLRDNLDFRQKIVAQGSLNLKNISSEALIQRWCDFIEATIPMMNCWQQQSWFDKTIFFASSRWIQWQNFFYQKWLSVTQKRDRLPYDLQHKP